MWDSELTLEIRIVLGDAFLAGPWTEDELVERALLVLSIGPRTAWIRPLARRAVETYRERPGDRHREFHRWLGAEVRQIARRAGKVTITGSLVPAAARGYDARSRR